MQLSTKYLNPYMKCRYMTLDAYSGPAQSGPATGIWEKSISGASNSSDSSELSQPSLSLRVLICFRGRSSCDCAAVAGDAGCGARRCFRSRFGPAFASGKRHYLQP